jgi:aminoglycoside 6'-N-acetyltransferase I
MIIRPVEKADWQQWLRMRCLLWPDTLPEDHELEMGGYFMQGANYLTWVVEKADHRLIGFLEVSIRQVAEDCDSRNVGYIEGWYVEPEFRKAGVGGMLVRHAEEWANSQGCLEMASDCVLDNEIGRIAHLALGFEETSRLIHFRKKLRKSSPSAIEESVS